MSIKELVNRTNKIIKNYKNKNMISKLNVLYKNYDNNDWIPYANFKEDKYTRNLVYRNDLFQMVVMCWPKKFVSPIHDHNESECLYKILKGELIETVYQKKDNKLIETDKFQLIKNEVGSINDSHGVHQVFNPHNDYCVSLHLYVPAYDKTDIFHLDDDNNFKIETVHLNFD